MSSPGHTRDTDRLRRKITKGLQHPAFEQRGSRQGCTHVERLKQAEFVEAAIDPIRNCKKQILPIEWLECGPRSFERLTGGDDRAVDILGAALCDPSNDRTRRWIETLECLARGGIYPLAGNE